MAIEAVGVLWKDHNMAFEDILGAGRVALVTGVRPAALARLPVGDFLPLACLFVWLIDPRHPDRRSR